MRIAVGFMVTVIALLWHHKSKGYFELIEELGCHDTEFRLTCGSFNASIAIFEATFSQNDTFLAPLHTSCGNPGHPPNKTSWKLYKLKDWEKVFHRKPTSNGVVEVNFRHAINRRFQTRTKFADSPESRVNLQIIAPYPANGCGKHLINAEIIMCSGVNYCSFVLSEDFQEGSRLGPGAVYLRYACVDDLHVTRACNSNIDVSLEGFVRTPGYPSYYIGESSCLWTLKASPTQRIKVTFLDVSLRGIAPFEGKCLDWLIVSEEGLNLLSTCGDILEDTLVLSDGSALNVTFKTTSKTLFPKRGFLFHYKALGCPPVRKPQDGYLISRNETFVHFRCCVGFVFPDTLLRDKVLKCYNENTWDGDIVDCANATQLLEETNSQKGNLSAEARAAMEMSDSFKDIIVPTIIMCILFIGNGIVLYIIYLQRRKLAKEEKIEMKDIPGRQREV